MKLFLIGCACAAINLLTVLPAHAESVAARAGAGVRGEYGAAGRRQGFVADGQGNATGGTRRAFRTDSGAYGGRSAGFNRSADGSLNASGQANASGANGTARRSGSYTRDASGNASGERNTSVTNSNTGTTFEGSTTYTKGEGFSRSASCTDAAGNTVTCGSR